MVNSDLLRKLVKRKSEFDTGLEPDFNSSPILEKMIGISAVELADMPPKRRNFLLNYVATGDRAKSARLAGFGRFHKVLFDDPTVKKVLDFMLIEKAKEALFSREDVLNAVWSVVTRDIIDLCDTGGRIILDDLRRIPARMRQQIDGVKVTERYDNDGQLVRTTEIKLVPKAPMINLAAKVLGLLEPGNHFKSEEDKDKPKAVDWDELYPAMVNDTIEEMDENEPGNRQEFIDNLSNDLEFDNSEKDYSDPDYIDTLDD